MAAPKLEKRNATRLAYLEFRGAYDAIPYEKAITQLYAWAKQQGVMPGFYPMGILFDDPQTIPAPRRRSQVAISFKGNGKPSAGVKTRSLAAMQAATYSHKGPSSEYANSYNILRDWMAKRNLKAAGPAIEVYSKRPTVEGGVTILYAKIIIPVKPASKPRAARTKTSK